MLKCPKCGHIDISAWRQNAWRTNVEFCKLDEFDNLKLLKRILKGEIVTDPDYAYRISGRIKKVVERILIEEFKAGGKKAFSIPREKKEHW